MTEQLKSEEHREVLSIVQDCEAQGGGGCHIRKIYDNSLANKRDLSFTCFTCKKTYHVEIQRS